MKHTEGKKTRETIKQGKKLITVTYKQKNKIKYKTMTAVNYRGKKHTVTEQHDFFC